MIPPFLGTWNVWLIRWTDFSRISRVRKNTMPCKDMIENTTNDTVSLASYTRKEGVTKASLKQTDWLCLTYYSLLVIKGQNLMFQNCHGDICFGLFQRSELIWERFAQTSQNNIRYSNHVSSNIFLEKPRVKTLKYKNIQIQGGPLLVINWVTTPINGLING